MQELVETRRELLAQIARGAKSWDCVDSKNSRNPRWIGRMIPAPENLLLESTVLTTGENGFDKPIIIFCDGVVRHTSPNKGEMSPDGST